MKTILIVEDEKSLNNAVALKFKKLGYKTISVFDGEEATKILEEGKDKIDFIWLDLVLPKMHGLDFLKWLRAQSDSELKDKKVAIVSVSGGDEIQKRAKKIGVIDYFVKNEYRLDDIVSRVAAKV
ncbi:hypothetical protein A2999_00650 [Candidatus Wolfebacteria bacterium RIFCSPLOWO2_01_FULL_38_11]|uniref:Two-component response regulator czcR n=2 Tax=Candidatus Wolfeibacteriota TaxID=1752735 RepID=A0A0G0G7J4_9BACT|nr:MAG: Two-component response regulator czcR [Candidatus Wolfebacteria bacterium GW2011_GWC1_37_10]OGM90731.1 MAG: hypothetical protein A2999_00650 [Candidatus Wolfebacteria bacterium RIFCSPLOWO2_01_FULL_38_11]